VDVVADERSGVVGLKIDPQLVQRVEQLLLDSAAEVLQLPVVLVGLQSGSVAQLSEPVSFLANRLEGTAAGLENDKINTV